MRAAGGTAIGLALAPLIMGNESGCSSGEPSVDFSIRTWRNPRGYLMVSLEQHGHTDGYTFRQWSIRIEYRMKGLRGWSEVDTIRIQPPEGRSGFVGDIARAIYPGQYKIKATLEESWRGEKGGLTSVYINDADILTVGEDGETIGGDNNQGDEPA
jgi:hypothetical protein